MSAAPSREAVIVDGSSSDPEDERGFQAVVNDEEQYSIWPADRPLPDGWRAVGKSGTRQECLTFIREVWTDMRPASLRKESPDGSS